MEMNDKIVQDIFDLIDPALKFNREGRVSTGYGMKSAIGVKESIKQILENNKEQIRI